MISRNNYCQSNDKLQTQVKDVDTQFQKDFESFCISTSYSTNTIGKAMSVKLNFKNLLR